MPRSLVIESYRLLVGILQEKLIEGHSSILSEKQSRTFCLSRLGFWESLSETVHFVAILMEIML